MFHTNLGKQHQICLSDVGQGSNLSHFMLLRPLVVFQVIPQMICTRTVFISEQTWENNSRNNLALSQKRQADRAHHLSQQLLLR